MAAYLRRAKLYRTSMIADEMLAIAAETEKWREKIQSDEAQASLQHIFVCVSVKGRAGIKLCLDGRKR